MTNSLRALVIDDSRAVRLLIGNILREIGIEVVEAANGREGLDRLYTTVDVDLILVDWNMPVMDGLEFVIAVRSLRVYDSIQILMVTTEAESEKVMQALAAGVNEYVMKPFTKEVLVAKLGMLNMFEE
jgi:two-component system chemotaxis response regulator CheY